MLGSEKISEAACMVYMPCLEAYAFDTHYWGNSSCLCPDAVVSFHEGFKGDRHSLHQGRYIQDSAVQADGKALLISNEDIVIRNHNSGAKEEHYCCVSIQCDVAAVVQSCKCQINCLNNKAKAVNTFSILSYVFSPRRRVVNRIH